MGTTNEHPRTPPLITRHGFLWYVEYDDKAMSPGTTRLVRGWTFTAAYRAAGEAAPTRANVNHPPIKPYRIERVTPLTVRYWEFDR